jgi:hypothetical protein
VEAIITPRYAGEIGSTRSDIGSAGYPDRRTKLESPATRRAARWCETTRTTRTTRTSNRDLGGDGLEPPTSSL